MDDAISMQIGEMAFGRVCCKGLQSELSIVMLQTSGQAAAADFGSVCICIAVDARHRTGHNKEKGFT